MGSYGGYDVWGLVRFFGTMLLLLAVGGYSATLPMWPFGAALALIALAAVFRYGARLQRDTEGLV